MRNLSGGRAERALGEAARKVAALAAPWQAASEAAAALLRELGAEKCEIALYDAAERVLRLVAGAGLTAEEAARLAERPAAGDPAEPALRGGAFLSPDGARACAPLVQGGRCTGAIRVEAAPGELDASVVNALEVMGALLGAALGSLPSVSSAEARLKDIGALAASVAHDFNNLLTTILGNARLLEQDADAAAKRRLWAISRAGRDGAQLVARLLDHARRRAPRLGPVDLAEAAREAVELTRPRWRDAHDAAPVRVELALGEGPPVLGDPTALRDAFVNLILNGIDAMPQGGTLTVRTGVSGAWVVGEVKDTGVGIAESELPRIFESFFTTKGDRGTGLGLTAVARAAREAGGTVEVESLPGKGSSFRLRLPPAPPSALPMSPALERADLPAARARPLAGLRALVVEDEDDNRDLLCEILRLAGAQARGAASAAEALELLGRGGWDVVVTDLGLPHESGAAVVQGALQLAAQRPAVVVVTGWDGGAAEVAEADVVLQKPIAPEALVGAIGRALEVRGAAERSLESAT